MSYFPIFVSFIGLSAILHGQEVQCIVKEQGCTQLGALRAWFVVSPSVAGAKKAAGVGQSFYPVGRSRQPPVRRPGVPGQEQWLDVSRDNVGLRTASTIL